MENSVTGVGSPCKRTVRRHKDGGDGSVIPVTESLDDLYTGFVLVGAADLILTERRRAGNRTEEVVGVGRSETFQGFSRSNCSSADPIFPVQGKNQENPVKH